MRIIVLRRPLRKNKSPSEEDSEWEEEGFMAYW
jgi:hypothetical protein